MKPCGEIQKISGRWKVWAWSGNPHGDCVVVSGCRTMKQAIAAANDAMKVLGWKVEKWDRLKDW